MKWFYIGNHSPCLPERKPSPPVVRPKWSSSPGDLTQDDELLRRIAKLKKDGVTGGSVVISWVGRRVQPLQKRLNFSFEYLGLDDPSRFSAEKMYEDEAMLIVRRVLLDVTSVPYMLKKLFRTSYPPSKEGVSYHNIDHFGVMKCTQYYRFVLSFTPG